MPIRTCFCQSQFWIHVFFFKYVFARRFRIISNLYTLLSLGGLQPFQRKWNNKHGRHVGWHKWKRWRSSLTLWNRWFKSRKIPLHHSLFQSFSSRKKCRVDPVCKPIGCTSDEFNFNVTKSFRVLTDKTFSKNHKTLKLLTNYNQNFNELKTNKSESPWGSTGLRVGFL